MPETLQINPELLAALKAQLVVANAAITGATKCKITYDSKGLVTGGADLTESDIPSLAISKITNLQSSLDAKQKTIHNTGWITTVSGGSYVLGAITCIVSVQYVDQNGNYVYGVPSGCTVYQIPSGALYYYAGSAGIKLRIFYY